LGLILSKQKPKKIKLMLSPKRTKYRKSFKLKPKGNTVFNDLHFGAYGLKALEPGRITNKQIESARRAITRKMAREGRVWIHLFPHTPVTSKPAEVRMGKGKGGLSYWAAITKPGRLLFEIDGVPMELAKQALSFGAGKLPLRTKFVQKTDKVV
jgi:large subunit ribosomal protein L16